MSLRCYGGKCFDTLTECKTCEYHMLCEESYELAKTDKHSGQLNEAITESPQETPEEGRKAELAAGLVELVDCLLRNPKYWQVFRVKLLHPDKPYSELAVEIGMRSKQHYQWYLRRLARECPIVKNSIMINKKYNSGRSIFND